MGYTPNHGALPSHQLNLRREHVNPVPAGAGALDQRTSRHRANPG